MQNHALVLSGGGAKGAFEVGAVNYLVNQEKLDFQVITGVSVGALNAAILAQAKDFLDLTKQVHALVKLWDSITSDDDIYLRQEGWLCKLLRKQTFCDLWAAHKTGRMYDSAPIWAKIQKEVNLNLLEHSGKKFSVGGVCLETGKYAAQCQTDAKIHEFILASASMPVFFPPVEVKTPGSTDEEHWVDGGLRNVTPLKEAFSALRSLPHGPNQPPDEMWVILASPLDLSEEKVDCGNALDVAMRAVSILVSEIFREDLAYALDINSSVSAYKQVANLAFSPGATGAQAFANTLEAFTYKPPKYEEVRIWTIEPRKEYSDTLAFNHAKILEAMSGGWQAAQNPLDENQLRQRLKALSRQGMTGTRPKPRS